MTHSHPIPYSYDPSDRGFIRAADGCAVVQVNSLCDEGDNIAAFIVNACNSHESLMELATLIDAMDDDPSVSIAEYWQMKKMARAALRQAA